MNFDHYDPAAMRAQLDNFEGRCGHTRAIAVLPGEHPHYARVECGTCGAFLLWMAGPKTIADQKRRRSYRMPTPVGVDYCVICNADAATLKSLGLGLTWAHKRDRAALQELGEDPGDDDLIRVCDWCHRDMERRRELLGRVIPLVVTGIALGLEPTTGIERPILPSGKDLR